MDNHISLLKVPGFITKYLTRILLSLFLAGSIIAPVASQTPLSLIVSQKVDVDAKAFLDAAGITNYIQRNAVNQLVIDYKAAGIWTKTIALYPIVGGTATSHKFNLKDPRDLDAAYRITWAGTLTHSATGVVGDASTGYGNMHVHSAYLTATDMRLCIYNGTNNSNNQRDIGSEQCRIWINYSGPVTRVQLMSATYVEVTAPTDKRGWYVGNRTGSTAWVLYRNNVSMASGSDASDASGSVNDDMYVLANNFGGSPVGNTDRECRGIAIGGSLNSTERAAELAAWDRFNTSLSRNVPNP